ncbi:MAG: hypothetical protein LBL36_07095 [Clostridiales Family XIII bacterium]|nr:hypothetical protein [Clostridiales Family XIII bacterium]
MTGTIFTIIGLLIGVSIAGASSVYLKREWSDHESRKIYGVFVGIGAAVTIGVVVKIFVAGF